MKNKTYSLLLSLIFFSSLIFIFSIDQAYAHKAKKHKIIKCIPESERTKAQLQTDKRWNFIHRLSKLQQDCAIIEIEKQKGKITVLEDTLGGIANCGDIPFNHKSTSKTKVYQKTDTKSNVVAEVKKGQELLFISPSQKDKNWYYVKVRKDKGCGDGYMQQKFVSKKISEDTTVKVGPKLIEIIDPNWAKEGKLILVEAEGTVSITGAIQEGKIDQIIINDEEELINSDNTFTFLLFVPNSGAEVRIIGNKNGKKIKELIFKVRAGK